MPSSTTSAPSTLPTPTPPAPAGMDPGLEIADLLGQVVRRLHRGTSEALAPLGLSRAQARVVRLLADGPLRMAAIAERLSVVPRTVTDLVVGVEAAGLVARHPDAADRRSSFVELTDDGRRLLDRLEAARRASAEQAFGRLEPEDRALLLRLLRDLAEEPADAHGPGADAGAERVVAAAGPVVAEAAVAEAAVAGLARGRAR